MPSNVSNPLSDYEPDWAKRFRAAAASGQLSTRDRKSYNKMRAGVAQSDEERLADLRFELSPENINALDAAIAQNTNPQIVSILLEERDKIAAMKSQLQAAQAPQQQKESEVPGLLDRIGDMLKNLWTASPTK